MESLLQALFQDCGLELHMFCFTCSAPLRRIAPTTHQTSRPRSVGNTVDRRPPHIQAWWSRFGCSAASATVILPSTLITWERAMAARLLSPKTCPLRGSSIYTQSRSRHDPAHVSCHGVDSEQCSRPASKPAPSTALPSELTESRRKFESFGFATLLDPRSLKGNTIGTYLRLGAQVRC